MAIYKYLRKSKLTEELHIEGLNFLGKAYGYELYDALTFSGAQSLFVNDTDKKAGVGWIVNGSDDEATGQRVFDAHIGDGPGKVHLYLFVIEGTNKAVMGAIPIGAGFTEFGITSKDIVAQTNYQFQRYDGSNEVDSEILPLFLLPRFQYKGHDGLITSENDILGNYKGFLNPDNLPAEVICDNLNRIARKAFSDYPIETVIIENVRRMESGAFTGYTGTIKCAAESFEDTGWPSDWAPANARVIWGIHLTPEVLANRLRDAKSRAKAEIAAYKNSDLYREEEKQKIIQIINDANAAIDACEVPADTNTEVLKAKELLDELKTNADYEREEAERRYQELQAAENLAVLRYKPIGSEMSITGCKPGREKLEIPEEIDGKPVTSIAPFAFFENTALTEVKLPKTIKTIGKAAFNGCSNATVYYPKTATLFSDALTGVRRKIVQ